jgi:hypothetical protein
LLGVAQQLLEDERLAPGLEIPQREALTQQRRIDALPPNPSPFPEAAKQEHYPILGERTPRLREEEMILADTSLLYRSCHPKAGGIQIRA